MIRSRSIPPVLARAAGDGIHAILLIDADGELLGSYGNPPPPPPPLHHQHIGGTGGYPTDDAGDFGVGSHGTPNTPPNSSSNANNTMSSPSADVHWPPLDAASIGALISEVAGDYRRMGEELWLLNPQYQHKSASTGDGKGSGDDNGERDQVGMQEGSSAGGSGGESEGELRGGGEGDGGGNKSSQTQQQQQGSGKDKENMDLGGTNLKSLVIELEYGVVGVASAGPDFYVIALADSTVQHGALAGRLRSLGSHVREAFSQLD